MEKRVCKVCLKEKQHNYLALNEQGRSVHKDEEGRIWHGKTCASCFAAYVKQKAGLPPLEKKICGFCGKEYMQKMAKQIYCCKICFWNSKL